MLPYITISNKKVKVYLISFKSCSTNYMINYFYYFYIILYYDDT